MFLVRKKSYITCRLMALPVCCSPLLWRGESKFVSTADMLVGKYDLLNLTVAMMLIPL